MLAEQGVRLPGSRRTAIAGDALREGIDIPAALLADLERLAGTT